MPLVVVACFPCRRPGGRHFDAYVQLRKLSDVQAALSVLPRRAVRYVPSGKVVPLRLEVDDTGFFVETVKDERRARLQREREARRANREKLRNARKERCVGAGDDTGGLSKGV
jgi:hypothetical protein